jgi:hypothetical protein
MPKLEAMAAVMLNIHRAIECLLCAPENMIVEFAIIAEAIIKRMSIFNVDLWLRSFSFSFLPFAVR